MKLMIVDDHVLFREGLAAILRSEKDIQIVGLAGCVEEAVSMAREADPDIILMDYEMPDGTGVEATRAILAENPSRKVVFMTIHEHDDFLLSAVRSGAKGFLTKDLRPAKLVAALRSVLKGEGALSRAMTMRLMEELSRTPEVKGPLARELSRLAPREVEVLTGIADGKTNQEIAKQLYLSENTVKFYVHSILEKLHIEDHRAAAAYARQHRLIQPSLG